MNLYHNKQTCLPLDLVARIDGKLKKLQSRRPFPSILVSKLRERLMLEMTYNSNAIEGNTLSLRETYLVINEGMTIKGKSFQEHIEAKNHHEALEFIYELINRNSRPTISEKLIRELQSLVISSNDKDIAGVYRRGEVAIAGAKQKPPAAFKVSELIDKSLLWFNKNQRALHPVDLAALFHHKLTQIHPFIDGNGRTARLIMNIILMREGYPLVVVLKNDRKTYYRTLEEADLGNTEAFITFIARTVERSLNIYLEALSENDTEKDKFSTLAAISKKVDFSPKYLNLLARKGKISAYKHDRNWFTSISSVEDYLSSRKRKR